MHDSSALATIWYENNDITKEDKEGFEKQLIL